MPLLREQDRRALSELFATQLQAPVDVDLFSQQASVLEAPAQPCETCRDTEELLREVAGLSDRIRLRVRDFAAEAGEARAQGIDRIPALVIRGQNRGRLRYFGVPSGYEFSVLVEALVDASRGTTRLLPRSQEEVGRLAAPVHIKVLVTPT